LEKEMMLFGVLCIGTAVAEVIEVSADGTVDTVVRGETAQVVKEPLLRSEVFNGEKLLYEYKRAGVPGEIADPYPELDSDLEKLDGGFKGSYFFSAGGFGDHTDRTILGALAETLSPTLTDKKPNAMILLDESLAMQAESVNRRTAAELEAIGDLMQSTYPDLNGVSIDSLQEAYMAQSEGKIKLNKVIVVYVPPRPGAPFRRAEVKVAEEYQPPTALAQALSAGKEAFAAIAGYAGFVTHHLPASIQSRVKALGWLGTKWAARPAEGEAASQFIDVDMVQLKADLSSCALVWNTESSWKALATFYTTELGTELLSGAKLGSYVLGGTTMPPLGQPVASPVLPLNLAVASDTTEREYPQLELVQTERNGKWVAFLTAYDALVVQPSGCIYYYMGKVSVAPGEWYVLRDGPKATAPLNAAIPRGEGMEEVERAASVAGLTQPAVCKTPPPIVADLPPPEVDAASAGGAK